MVLATHAGTVPLGLQCRWHCVASSGEETMPFLYLSPLHHPLCFEYNMSTPNDAIHLHMWHVPDVEGSWYLPLNAPSAWLMCYDMACWRAQSNKRVLTRRIPHMSLLDVCVLVNENHVRSRLLYIVFRKFILA